MKGLLHLYLKDIKAHRVVLAIHVAVVTALAVGLVIIVESVSGAVQESEVPGQIIIGLMFSQIHVLFVVWLCVASYYHLSREWKEGSMALWLSLPVCRWKLLVSKLAALLTVLLLLAAIPLIIFILVKVIFPASAVGEHFPTVSMTLVLLVAGGIPFLPATFAVYLSSTFSARYPWLPQVITIGVLIAAQRLGEVVVYEPLWGVSWGFYTAHFWVGLYTAALLGLVLSLGYINKELVA